MPTGTIHYYCDCQAGAITGCQAGNDTNAGTSPSAPRQTTANAMSVFSSLQPGDAIAFCRGGVFSQLNSQNFNSNARATTPIYIRDYKPSWAPASAPRPRVPGNWQFAVGGNHQHQEGIVVTNISSTESFLFNDSDYVTFCNMEFLNGGNGLNIGTCNGGTSGDPSCMNDHATFQGNRVINQSNMGVVVSGDVFQVIDNYFYNNGGTSSLNHTMYLGGDKYAGLTNFQTGYVVSGNEIHPPNATNGVAIVVHGRHSGMQIQKNYIVNDLGNGGGGAWGISTWPGYGGQTLHEVSQGLLVSQNTIIGGGNSNIEIDACQNCLVENNLIISTDQASRGIHSGHGSGCSVSTGDCLASSNVTIRNNTIYQTVAGSTGVVTDGNVPGTLVANNAVQTNGTCLAYNDPSGNYIERDYNLINVCSDAVFGAHDKKAVPLWITPGTNFKPQAGSPLIGAGDSSQKPTFDITGLARPTPPAIGAYEP